MVFEGFYLATDFFECAQLNWLVEVPGRGDLVTSLGDRFINPGIGNIREYLSPEEHLNATRFQKWHLLAVAQFGIGFVLDNHLLTMPPGRIEPMNRIWLGLPRFVDLLDHRSGLLIT